MQLVATLVVIAMVVVLAMLLIEDFHHLSIDKSLIERDLFELVLRV